ncbi:MAG: DUF4350 domain-containing protein [Actinomyces sp.]|uniref:DUF4350 domain-containing protein n=1 Tax=Actinomyces sp. TaxID=29317 RepID=UPI0026DAFA05|nr:DUF4350 domain-containing protein [Actinomyces sp.]MDO4242267.1 DUF4350 domain-containing protein [Actinomyces sp.]
MSGGTQAAPTDRHQDQVVGRTLRERLRRWRPFVLLIAGLAAVTVLTAMLRPGHSTVPYAINNPGDNGAQALAQLLRDEGIGVSTASTVRRAAEAGSQGATIAVVNARELSDSDLRLLAASGGDVVVLDTMYSDLSGLTGMEPAGTSAPAGTELTPQCPEEDAVAAATLDGSKGTVRIGGVDGAVGCFPVDEGVYAYATAPLETGATVRVISDASIVTNAKLAEAGNAALAIRALGHHERIVWLDGASASATGLWDSPAMPRWLPVALLQAGFVVLALAVVRGRRFGRIVTEEMPVVVRSTETTIGRGRLYRRAADRERAAQALRAGTASRLGRLLGLTPTAGRHELVQAVARAGGQPPQHIDRVLYGPVPPDDRSLVDLGVELDRLESEVHPQ